MNFILSNIHSLIISFIDQNRVKVVININNFLNLIEKRINDYKKNIFNAIIKQYILIKIRNHKINKEKKIISKIIYAKTLFHLYQL